MRPTKDSHLPRFSLGGATSFLMQHRGMVTLDRKGLRISASLLFGISLTALLIWLLPAIGLLWGIMSSWIGDLTGFSDTLTMSTFTRGETVWFQVPYFDISTTPLSGTVWTVTAISVVILLIVSFFITERFTPLKYGIRALLIVQTTALVFFATVPERFPYTAPDYLRGMMTTGLFVLVLVPLVLAVTYYLLDFSFIKKIGLTVLILGYLMLSVPLQYAAHAMVLANASLMFMPILYLVFGLPLNVFSFIALYSWGMSWKSNSRRPATVPMVNNLEKPGLFLSDRQRAA